jgi:hypoxanthine phosphoribosyltransferase
MTGEGYHGGYRISVLISERELQERIRALGELLAQHYAGETVTVVGVLKGSFIFMSDLVRAMNIPVRCEFLGVSSYGDDTRSSGEVKVTSDLTQPIHGQHVLVVEDIIDTGLTLAYILRNLSTRGPRSIKLCCLLDKRERRQIEIESDFVGFTIPNKFVVGYGLDYQGLLRNLPYIGVMESSEEERAHVG